MEQGDLIGSYNWFMGLVRENRWVPSMKCAFTTRYWMQRVMARLGGLEDVRDGFGTLAEPPTLRQRKIPMCPVIPGTAVVSTDDTGTTSDVEDDVPADAEEESEAENGTATVSRRLRTRTDKRSGCAHAPERPLGLCGFVCSGAVGLAGKQGVGKQGPGSVETSNPYASALDGLDIPDPVQAFFDFCREREQIRLRRERGETAPWSDDPILQRGRFLNVFREDDRGSKSIQHFVAGHGPLNCRAWSNPCFLHGGAIAPSPWMR